MPIYIKSKHYTSFSNMRTGLLLDPDVEGLVSNDDELYSAVAKAGKATIVEYNEDLVTLKPKVTIDADTFEQEWRGD